MIDIDNKPIYRLAEETDKESVLALLNEVFNDQQRSLVGRGEDYWNWKFTKNPFGKSLLIVIQWGDEIVGVANLWPWEFQYQGKVIKALQSCDVAVKPAFQGRGLFKESRSYALKIANKNNYNLLFNFPNKNSLPAYLSLNWNYLGIIPWRVKVLKPINLIKGYFSKNSAKALEIDAKYTIDASYLDELANRNINFDNHLKINRVKGFHQWRYLDRPNRSYGMVIYKEKRKETVLIFTINQNNSNREMVIVDIIGAPTNLIPLFKKINKVAKEMNVDFIAVMDNPQYKTKKLLHLGYFKKKSKNMVTLPLNGGLEEKLTSFSNWSLMASMHDSI
jgi:predicted N-acetyltransferase YhbS